MIQTIEGGYIEQFDNHLRNIKAKVDVEASTKASISLDAKKIKSIQLDRAGDINRFFGYSICNKATITLFNEENLIIKSGDTLNISMSINKKPFVVISPKLIVDNVERKNNTIELTAYDSIYYMKFQQIEKSFPKSYTILDLLPIYVERFKLMGYVIDDTLLNDFKLFYPEGANLDGKEDFRTVLNQICEATGTSCFINYQNKLVFKRITSRDIDYLIGKDKQFSLTANGYKRLKKIVSTTELGDNVGVEMDGPGETQYLRDNAFLVLRQDLAQILDKLIDVLGGLELYDFNCSWRGCFLLEPFDTTYIIGNSTDQKYISVISNDKITYTGGMKQVSIWNYTSKDTEVSANPSNLGEALNQTKATVDKANKRIELVVSETNENAQKISSIISDTNGIKSSVSNIEKVVKTNSDKTNQEIVELTKRVNATMTEEEVKLEVEKGLSKGSTSTTTITGYVFDENGLTISRSDREMKTQITENGMTVSKNGSNVLVANNRGVDAENLHATTYLIIGNNSRLEDMGDETACFWIGG